MRSSIVWASSLLILFSFVSFGCSSGSDQNSFTGTLEGRVYSVASPVSDRLTGLTVSEGDSVTQGQVIGTIDIADLQLQKKALVAKKDQLSLQLEELKLNIAQAKDTRDYYVSNYTKNLELLKKQAVSDQTVRDLKLNADKWERDLSGLRLKAQSLERQQDELGYKLDELDLLIGKASLTSPAAGYVDKIFYETGEFVPALRTVAQVISLDDVWCYLYVGEKILAELSPGQEVEARFHDRTFTARVEHINSKAEFTPKEILTPENRAALVYAVRVRIDNPDGVLKIGMPVEIRW